MKNNQKENSKSLKQSESKTDQSAFELQADEMLAFLDITADIPDGLVDKVIAQKESFSVKDYSRFDFSKYLQIAAVFAAAVCIGIIMGKNADVNSFNKKQLKKERALIELREKHHLSDKDSFGKL